MDVTNVNMTLPDFAQMQNVQDQVFHLIENWDMNVLPGAREQLGELRTLLLAVERAFKESLIGAIVLLEDRDFIPVKQGADTHYRLASVLSRLSQLHSLLARQNVRLELFTLSALVEPLSELDKRIVSLQNQALAFDQRLAQLRQQRADIG
ncbi:hypothetical protein PPUJ20028_16030 [Pseudomonas putida]|uniref:Uncharacterized protein n=1 Tax=Pseudomonas putida TaxID=303 RepID=A0AA37R7H4_PSEPU|nr:hypothetical protein [Pseudomonas putida]GLO13022.1 hypothetical protein PPUJ20028_16030 [Pseudomonas putida]GLO36132.1 hypothetical protein PPUN14671_29670 [Pseudomonas putida]